MRGFMINTYDPVTVLYKGKTISMHPYDGMFTFIYDYYAFVAAEHPEQVRPFRGFRFGGSLYISE